MATRFGKQKQRNTSVLNLGFSLLFFTVFLTVMLYSFQNIAKQTEQEQLKSAELALRRAVVQCYALEGQYPPNIKYLEDHYGLQMNQDKYVIHYQSLGGNLLPQISIFCVE